MDYLHGESIKINGDIYNQAIAANLTKEVSPVILTHCIKLCILTYFIQVLICLFFCYELLSFENFQPFYVMQSSLRIVATLLLHQSLYKKLQHSVKLLIYLKRLKKNKIYSNGRKINIMLCTMQISCPLLALTSLMVTMG